MKNLQIAFDVGHSSIGWAVLESSSAKGTKDASILGCGVVTFRADDCLASTRRAYRRQRRHIRSTRQRIERMKVLLQHLGVLTREELDRPGCAWPWLLAARVLSSKSGQNPAILLTWPELWDVLRWYAHNRGYDGNRKWSAADAAAQAEDTEKEAHARTLMHEHGTHSMAETVCAVSDIDPFGTKKSCNVGPSNRFKAKNAAFPRDLVEREVRRLLEAHSGKLKCVDTTLQRALFSDWRATECPGLKLPKRYVGGLLFGQIVPRFDNRIVSTCPITYHLVFNAELEKGADREKAHRTAEKLAKVPSRNCREFLDFRWAMQLANIRVVRFGENDLVPLKAEERKDLDSLMREQGAMGVEEFKKAVRLCTSAIRDNLDTMFMHPDAKEALLLDPMQRLVTADDFQHFWKMFPEILKKRLRGKWRRGKSFSLAEMRGDFGERGGNLEDFDTALQKQLDGTNSKHRKKDKSSTTDDLLKQLYPSKPIRLDGRASFSKPLLKQAYAEAMAGKHPKEPGGCLFISEEIRQAQSQRELDRQTNNHLVRHRLRLLGRLLHDIIAAPEYANSDRSKVSRVTIEVNRDLRDMSGMTAKEKAQELGLRIANHHHVAEKLEQRLREEGHPVEITAGLIRNARIAEDLGWKCPYTGLQYEPKHLLTRHVEKDHLVPRSDRPSDSLDSLVITFSAINKWKGKRTAYQFVEQEQGKPVPDLPNLSILSLVRYRELVQGLESYKGHDDDKRRKERRKRLMLLRSYEEKEFTPGDLTQTSQLVRLGAQVVKREFAELEQPPIIVSLPGAVTGQLRKSWKLLGCLAQANPQVLDSTGEIKNKDEIRDITHLHHALDACVLGLAAHFIPNNGRVWQLIVKRNLNEVERRELEPLGIFDFNPERRFQLRDLDTSIKEQIRRRLAEKRVAQHIPARIAGLRVEQNAWRVMSVRDGEATILQRMRQPDGSRPEKLTQEKAGKLLGLQPGKLQKNKAVLVIPDNFGVALDPAPAIIPFHKVWARLLELKAANGGKMPRILRNGQLVEIPAGKFKGIWRVFSAKNNATGIALDIGYPDVVRLKNKTEGHKINVRLATLLRDGLRIMKAPLTGIPVCPTTSSA